MIKPRGKQFEVIDLPMEGHNVVLGSAGSGKSTCAILRSHAIADILREKVLLLTYNNSLVNYLNNIIEIKENIGVKTYHKFVVNYLKAVGRLGYNSIVNNEDKKNKYIKEAIKIAKIQYGEVSTLKRETFIIEEIDWMQKVGCLTLNEYETITRYGRGKDRLEKTNRKYVFSVYENYVKIRKEKGYQYDWSDIAYYANKHIEANGCSKEYKHIIIDEGQDFSPTMIKFLVNYVGDNGSIMYLGDAAQQIFGSNGTWISSGLVIRKAYKLEQNYRNTKEIEALGNEIRKNIQLSDQDVKLSQNSESSGEIPMVVKAKNSTEEMDYVINKAKELKETGSVAIIAKSKKEIREIDETLYRNIISHLNIDRNQKDFKGQKEICIGTYHALKGLEFDSVILYNCTDEGFACDDIEELEVEQQEELLNKVYKLLYVGVTRARKNLIITYMNKLVQVFPKNTSLYNLRIIK